MPADTVTSDYDERMDALRARLEGDEIVLYKPLSSLDLCDRDNGGAQAYVRLGKGNQDLLLCKHHFELHELALLAQGFTVLQDTRDQLSKVASPIVSDGVA